MPKITSISILLVLLCVLAACGGDEEKDATSTPPGIPTATAEIVPTADLGSIAGSTATDGICQMTIPDDWVDDGTGRGVTTQGDQWSLFGGSIADDAGWTSAKELLKSQMSGQEGVEVRDDGNIVTILVPNGRGFVVRERIENRYCEFAVTARGDRSEEIASLWTAISDSIELAPSD